MPACVAAIFQRFWTWLTNCSVLSCLFDPISINLSTQAGSHLPRQIAQFLHCRALRYSTSCYPTTQISVVFIKRRRRLPGGKLINNCITQKHYGSAPARLAASENCTFPQTLAGGGGSEEQPGLLPASLNCPWQRATSVKWGDVAAGEASLQRRCELRRHFPSAAHGAHVVLHFPVSGLRVCFPVFYMYSQRLSFISAHTLTPNACERLRITLLRVKFQVLAGWFIFEFFLLLFHDNASKRNTMRQAKAILSYSVF